MRALPVALSVVLLLLAPHRAASQPLQSFQDLALRVNLNDRLRVEDLSGGTTTGRLARLTRDEITMDTDAGEKRFTTANVREITVRRRSTRKGILIGALVGAAAGAVAACTGSDRSECADGPILLGSLGAGVGLAVSAIRARVVTVYPSPIGAAPSAVPPGPLDELALRINLDDQLRVEDLSGTKTTGRLLRMTGDEITLATDAGEKRFTSASVSEVAVRGHSFGLGALIGAGAFAALAAAAPACRSNPDCSPLAAGAFGAGVGLAAAAIVPRMTTVYRAQEKHASFTPVITRSAVGVRASLAW